VKERSPKRVRLLRKGEGGGRERRRRKEWHLHFINIKVEPFEREDYRQTRRHSKEDLCRRREMKVKKIEREVGG